MKRNILQSAQWIFAALAAFAVVNILLFIYERPVGWIERTNSATDAIWNPGGIMVYGTEGYGVYKVDANGYINPSLPSVRGGIRLQ